MLRAQLRYFYGALSRHLGSPAAWRGPFMVPMDNVECKDAVVLVGFLYALHCVLLYSIGTCSCAGRFLSGFNWIHLFYLGNCFLPCLLHMSYVSYTLMSISFMCSIVCFSSSSAHIATRIYCALYFFVSVLLFYQVFVFWYSESIP